VKVTHVGLESPATRAGGLNRYLSDLVAAERRVGIEASAVVLGDVVECDTVGAGSPRAPLLVRGVRVDRAVRRLGRPDVADLHFAGTAAVTSVLGALRSVPTVVHFQGPWADESAASGASARNVALKRALERRVYRRADRIVVLTGAFGRVLRDAYGVAPWAITVQPPGVDLARFTRGDRATARAALGAPSARVVVAVRRLVPRMGLDVLLEAWAALAPSADDLLAVVGDGPERGALEERARALGIAAHVRLCGGVDDDELVRWYRAADVTVVPSVALEGFGLVVLESLACGTPVVGTDADGLAEAIASTGQGPAVRAGDAAALAAGLGRALGVPRDEASDASRREVAERHGWDAVALRHRAIYEDVASSTAPPRVVLLDHTAVLSGGELAIARAVGGLGARASVHAILAVDGPLRGRLEAAGATVEVIEMDESARAVARDEVAPGRLGAAEALATLRYIAVLARRLRALRPDVVHTNSLKSALYGGAAARLARVPCVWHVRDRIESPYLPSPAVRLVRRAARHLPSVVVANSRSTLETVGVEGLVVPSPLDASIDPHRAREDHDGPLRVAVLGRLAPWKGQHLAIEAFAAAFPTGGATLRVVGAALFGEDDYAATLPALAEELGVASRVEFCGFVDDIASVLYDVDVVVHCSILAEPFGQVVIEAMGAGCAVVVADAGGPADLVTDERDGLHYPMGDRDALAAALRRLDADRALRARLGAAAQREAATYTPAALAQMLLGAWRQATEASRGGARRGW